MLPVGFQTDYKTKIKSILDELDNIISGQIPDSNSNKAFIIELSLAQSIIDKINEMLIFEPGFEWDSKAFKACLDFLSKNAQNKDMQNKVWCVVRYDQNIKRKKDDGSFSNAPDTGTGETALTVAREATVDVPALILIRQIGSKDKGWMDSPFWWPVMIAPKKMRTVIFANELADME